MKYFWILFIVASCARAPSNEMELMGEDVLKAKQGLEIQIFPLPKEAKK